MVDKSWRVRRSCLIFASVVLRALARVHRLLYSVHLVSKCVMSTLPRSRVFLYTQSSNASCETVHACSSYLQLSSVEKTSFHLKRMINRFRRGLSFTRSNIVLFLNGVKLYALSAIRTNRSSRTSTGYCLDVQCMSFRGYNGSFPIRDTH